MNESELMIVYWPGQATVACPEHLHKLVGLAAILGFQLSWTPAIESAGCDNCRTEKARREPTDRGQGPGELPLKAPAP